MVHHQWSWRKRRRRRRRQEEEQPPPTGGEAGYGAVTGTDAGTVLRSGHERLSAAPYTSMTSTASESSYLDERVASDRDQRRFSEQPETIQQNSDDGRSYPHERIREQRSTYTRHQRYHSPRGGGSSFLFSFFPSFLSSFLPSLLLFLFLLSVPAVAAEECRRFTKDMRSLYTLSPTLSPNERAGLCFEWASNAPTVLCEKFGDDRLRLLGNLHLLIDLHEESVTVLDMLLANTSSTFLDRLRPGVNGRDCFERDQNKCTACFIRIDDQMQRLMAAQASFERALNRFDCLPAVDTASATRPFSPNASCLVCKMWYKRWLASQLLGIWNDQPCIEWCYSAQLACPHLATSRVVDYAGHPSFQCTDLNIPLGSSSTPCKCVHPCDIKGVVNPKDSLATSDMCTRRRLQCASPSSSSSSASRSLSSLLLLLLLLLILSAASSSSTNRYLAVS